LYDIEIKPHTDENKKRVERSFKNSFYEYKETKGGSDEEIIKHRQEQLEMLIAPINESYEKGEISYPELILGVYHIGIKTFHESIKRAQERINMHYIWPLSSQKP